MKNHTYAQQWADAINEAYTDCELSDFLTADDKLDGEDDREAERRILTKAARILAGHDFEATFTGPELDAVRHLMPAHKVDRAGALRWVREVYGE
jgi:hypothetical protein